MATKRAKTLNDKQFDKLCSYIQENSTMPERDILFVALSFKAGLRVGEIQKIDLSAMLDVEGSISSNIQIFSNVAKKNRERSIPVGPFLRKALVAFRRAYPNATCAAISSQPFRFLVARGRPIPKDATFKRMSLTSLTNYMGKLLKEAGFKDASSHSGRRTFGTKMAQQANQYNCSLRDVQLLMGHARLETTEAYIEVSKNAKSLVAAI